MIQGPRQDQEGQNHRVTDACMFALPFGFCMDLSKGGLAFWVIASMKILSQHSWS